MTKSTGGIITKRERRQLEAMGFKVRRNRQIDSKRHHLIKAKMRDDGSWEGRTGRAVVVFSNAVAAASWMAIEESNQ